MKLPRSKLTGGRLISGALAIVAAIGWFGLRNRTPGLAAHAPTATPASGHDTRQLQPAPNDVLRDTSSRERAERGARSGRRVLKAAAWGVMAPLAFGGLGGVHGRRRSSWRTTVVNERAAIHGTVTLDLIDGLPMAVLAADASGVLRLANRRAHDWAALPLDALTSTVRMQDVLVSLGCPPALAAAALNDQDIQCEATTLSGRPVCIESRRVGGALPVLVTVMDMSGIKAGAAAKTEALNHLSHDMRAPLSSIAAIVQTPLADHEPATVEQTLRTIGRLTYRTLDLANEFLALVHADDVGCRAFEPVCLNELVEFIADEFVPRATAQGCELQTPGGWQQTWVTGDAVLLARALRNLIDNALGHCGHGVVHIALHPCGNQAVLTIADTGPGFTANHLAGCAAPSATASGFGLGLRFVERVAQLHGGQLALANRLTGGALATLSFPLLTPEWCLPVHAQQDPGPPATAVSTARPGNRLPDAQQSTCA